MELTVEKLNRLTFPTASVGGYRKQDVDDFLAQVAQDYQKFTSKIEELTQQQTQALEANTELKEYYAKREQHYQLERTHYQQEMEDLKKERRSFEEGPKTQEKPTSFQQTIMIAQDAAFEIEQAAEEEKRMILEQAEFDRGRIIKNARAESTDILEKAQAEKQKLADEAVQIKQNAERHAQAVKVHYQETLRELSEKKRKQEEQAKSDLSKLEYQKQELKQEITTGHQEESTFIESQVYEYKQLIHQLNHHQWQEKAEALTKRLQKI